MKKTKKETRLIEAIKEWLELPGNNSVKLAAELGYSTSNVINMWIKRKTVPGYVEKRVKEIIGMEE